MMKDISSAPQGEEESTTVGAEVTSISNTSVPATPTEDKEVESGKLLAIPEAEEALEVGTEMG